jgi:type II secretory pathway component PulM
MLAFILALSESDLLSALPNLGACGFLAIAVYALWKTNSRREAQIEARVTTLEAQRDQHAVEYRALTDKVTCALMENSDVMRQQGAALSALVREIQDGKTHEGP